MRREALTTRMEVGDTTNVAEAITAANHRTASAQVSPYPLFFRPVLPESLVAPSGRWVPAQIPGNQFSLSLPAG